MRAFLEKPKDPVGLPDAPHEVLASMGNYVFDTDALVDAVTRDADEEDTKHDMGGDIVPDFVSRGEAGVYDFKDNDVPGSTDRDRDYWRDVGTLDSYYDAHMEPRLRVPRLQPLQLRLGHLHRLRPAPAGQVRARVARPHRSRREQLRLPRRRRLRRDGRELRAVARLLRALVVDGQRQRAARRRAGRPARRRPPGDRRQERRHPRQRAHRHGPGGGPGPGLSVTDSGLVVIGKGQVVPG
nr:sugar phosphate nucleotidyltransferase [Angustibacter aerolatus]